MSKKLYLVASLAFIILLGLVVYNPKSQSVLHLNSRDIFLIVRDTAESRVKGLSGRDSLADDTAMIFVFDKPEAYAFWMKDMKFPIDIIWLDGKFTIVDIRANISPSTYPEKFVPMSESVYVLETNANFAEKNSLKIGDTLSISLIK